MDDIKRPRTGKGMDWRQSASLTEPFGDRAKTAQDISSQKRIISLRIARHPLRQMIAKFNKATDKKMLRIVQRIIPSNLKRPLVGRVAWGALALMVLSTLFIDIYNFHFKVAAYALSPMAEKLIPAAQAPLADSIKRDERTGSLDYNKGYNPGGDKASQGMTPKFSASFSNDVKQGMTVTDPVSGAKLGIISKFGLHEPQQDQNRIVYPLRGYDAQKVYTLQAVMMKEDIIINSYEKDKMNFEYELKLPEGTEAFMEPDGSVGIYGVDLALLGNVQTGNDKDAKLLSQARKKAARTTLLFRFPAPYIKESGKTQSNAKAWYGLKEATLTVYTSGLKKASYPLSVDPTIYIETASKLMKGNNESNIDFDVDNELIQKGKTTGGRFDAWVDTVNSVPSLQLPAGIWRHATAAAGGYVYVAGGMNSFGATTSNFYWAKLNSQTGVIEAPNPGNGSCGGWCTNAAYSLPDARRGATMAAYNGYLYVIGGIGSSGTVTSTVYIAKLGANGSPELWHPTSTNKTTWTYWFQDTNLSAARAYLGAVAYNNRMYIVGGSTATDGLTGGITTVEKYDISPIGKLLNRTTMTGGALLPEGRMGHGLQAYNDRLYVIGGMYGGITPAAAAKNTVYVSKINTDGSINDWRTTTPIGNGAASGNRASFGGTMTTIWGGFIYVAGGCNSVNSSGYCTSISTDTQLASINADGTITDWTTVLGVNSSRMGYGLVSWRNRLYAIGGCSVQNTTSGSCTSVLTTAQIGAINPDGDVSTVSTSLSPGSAPCTGTTATNCDLPSAGGDVAGAVVINNGYIYYIGGCNTLNSGRICANGASGKATAAISYAAIAADGDIVRVTTCNGTFVTNSSWCLNATGLPAVRAGFGTAIFDNTLYVIGGTTGAQNGWVNTIFRTTLNASNGSWGTWYTQNFSDIGISQTQMGYMYAFTRANPSSAATLPANLYIIGGCYSPDIGLNCGGTEAQTFNTVYKCSIAYNANATLNNRIDPTTGGNNSPCTTTGQLQLDAETDTAGSQGLGVMAGTVYANYVYLMGGQSPNKPERGEVMYAKIDDNNNIVSTDGGSIWITSSNQISPVRRRGVAFGYNGYLYALAGYNVGAGGSLQDLLYAKINVSDGSISPFATSTVTVTPRWDLRVGVNNGYVYAAGGCSVGTPPASCTTLTPTVQTFQLYNNYSGSPKSYTANAQAQFSTGPTQRYGASATIMNGYIYVAGGCTSTTDCTATTNSVQYAQLSADGNISAWSAGGNLPASLAWGQLENVGGTLYYVGGQNNAGTAQSTIYYTSGITNGNPTWSATSASGGIGDTASQAAQPRSKMSAASWNNRLYVVGGVDGSGNPSSTVYISPQLKTGGDIAVDSWISSTSFTVARHSATAIAYANNLYILGGTNGSEYLHDVQFTQINSDGTVDPWKFTTSLPTRLSGADGFAANGFMYLFGGRSTDTLCQSNTIVAPISANTTIASGNNPTGIGEWYATNVRYASERYGGSAVYDQGRTYVIGGFCNGALTPAANQVQASTLQSQPQVARYSRMIDTDSDVTPTVWLMNGLDNSTGARWFMRYRSSTAANLAWGVDTNFGEVALARAEKFYPKDGAGANTNRARFYYLIVTIDSQQAYGYPEDVSRGPTIADLSLFYTADPNKRLLHGKTFSGGEQQPLDTPCSYDAVNQPNCPQ